MDIGQDGQAGALADGAEDAAALNQPRAAKAFDRGAVRLVVTRLENVRDAEVGGNALDGVGHGAGVLLGLDDTGAADEEEPAASHGDPMGSIADVEGIGHRCYLTIAAARSALPQRRA